MPHNDPNTFPPEEAKRRFEETMRRACGMKPTMDLKTGQPLDGEQFSQMELERRGYDRNYRPWFDVPEAES